jgi:hypothetical protein
MFACCALETIIIIRIFTNHVSNIIVFFHIVLPFELCSFRIECLHADRSAALIVITRSRFLFLINRMYNIIRKRLCS